MPEEVYQIPLATKCAKCGKDVDLTTVTTFEVLMYQNRGICLECFYEECE